jgi:3-hydroxyisobutyrate dehydrogenase-like beta-hydroxyacid dehydrogenase
VRIGFVGVGNMGASMASNLLAAGHDVSVCDVRADAVDALVARGAKVAETPAVAADGAEVVSIAVMDGAQVARVTTGPDGVLARAAPGAVVAVHSTVHPRSVRTVADAAPPDVAVLDAPISGGVQGARDATLCIMVGGDAGAFERARPAFDSMGSLVLHIGDLGAGLAAKLARNLVGYVTLVAAYEGRLLGAAAGVDEIALFTIARHTGALSPMMQATLDVRGGDEVYRANVDPLVDLAEKDLDVTLEFAAELGVELPATRLTREKIATVLRGGLG